MELLSKKFDKTIGCNIQIKKQIESIATNIKITSKLSTKANIQKEKIFETYANKIDKSNEQKSKRRLKRK